MQKILKRLGRYRRLGAGSFIACCCFIGLALYGWGVSWSQLGGYLLCVVFFLIVLLLAALLAGWLLRKIMS